MPDAAMPWPFHFLRPWWLAALLPALGVLVLILRYEHAEARWAGSIAPHLLKHLLVKPPGRWRLRPAWLVAAGLLIAIVALAGPMPPSAQPPRRSRRPADRHRRPGGPELAARTAALRRGQGATDDRAGCFRIDGPGRCRPLAA